MLDVRDPITAPLDHLDLVVKALLKSARLAIAERRQKAINAFQIFSPKGCNSKAQGSAPYAPS